MEEKENNNTFRSVGTYNPKSGGFGKTVLVPFLSGIVGASLVMIACFGVPEIKEQIIGSKETNTNVEKTQTNQVNATAVSLTEYSDTAIGVAAKVIPSIVGIEIEYNVNSIFGRSTATATGSGIIMSEDGYILTNNHVVNSSSASSSYYQVSQATSIKVKIYNDETVYEGKIVGADDQTDLAVIKIDKTGLTPAEFGDSEGVKVGEFAMAIGTPLGLATSATSGIISAVNREVTAENRKYTVIQTDAAINSGNSGGALVNSKGQVIGINTLKLSGDGVEGIGFAIPISSTTEITKQLIEHNKVIRPYVGIQGRELDEETARRYNLVEGVYVQVVEDFAAAQKAGIKVGDVITEFDGQKIKTVEEINNIKNKHNIGDIIKVKIYRSGEYKEIELKFEEQP